VKRKKELLSDIRSSAKESRMEARADLEKFFENNHIELYVKVNKKLEAREHVKAFWLQSISLSFYRFDSKSREKCQKARNLFSWIVKIKKSIWAKPILIFFCPICSGPNFLIIRMLESLRTGFLIHSFVMAVFGFALQ
jgi:hypothetical protein